MILITYPNADIRTIRRERYSHPDIAIRRRMTLLALHSEGIIASDIPILAGVSRTTVYRCLRKYQNGGLSSIYEYDHRPRRHSELEHYAQQIMEDFDAHAPSTLNEARERIAALTGLRRSLPQIRAFLKKKFSLSKSLRYSRQGRCRETK
jgi:transposase